MQGLGNRERHISHHHRLVGRMLSCGCLTGGSFVPYAVNASDAIV